MRFDLEYLIKRFKRAMNNLPVNKEGKHMIAMEDVIEYIQYIIDDDDYFCDEEDWEDDEYEED
jgi:hypothetical protein